MSEPLRILIAIDNFHPLVGGAETAVRETAQALAARGHRVDVLTMRKRPEWPAEEQFGGVRVFRFDERIPPRPFGRLLYERANAAAARRFLDGRLAGNNYQVFWLHPIDAAFGIVRSRSAANAARIYGFHAPLGQEHMLQTRGLLECSPPLRGGDPVRHGVAGYFEKLADNLSAAWTARYRASEQREAIRRCHAVTCPSHYSRNLLIDSVPRPGETLVRVIPWGVDASRFCPAADRSAIRGALGWEADELVVFTARRLVPRMGLDRLIQAFALVAQREPRSRLVIAGEGPMRGHLQTLAERSGAHVGLQGLVAAEDLLRRYQAADLVVLPSRELEAFGLIILEALACGTPVLATRRGAVPEILGPLDPRLLIPSDEPQAIADTLLGPGLALARDPSFRDRCRAYAAEHYSWERTAAAFQELARQALGVAARGTGRGTRDIPGGGSQSAVGSRQSAVEESHATVCTADCRLASADCQNSSRSSVGEQWLASFAEQSNPYAAERTDKRFFDDCLALPHTRLLVRAAELRGGERVLEAGCGIGKYAVALAIRGCRATALDYSPDMVRNAERLRQQAERFFGPLDFRAVEGNVEALDFPDGAFDLVFSAGVIEHWLDAQERIAVLREMLRVTRPGGTLLAMVPNTGHPLNRWWVLTGYPGHKCPPMARYTVRKLREELAAAGCCDVASDGFEPLNSMSQWPNWWPLRKLTSALNRLCPQPKWLRERLGVGLAAWGRKKNEKNG